MMVVYSGGMARKLNSFPEESERGTRRYPWADWTDGGVWEIRRGEDYDVATENMRVNLHMKASSLTVKLRSRRISDDRGEGLVFQFLKPTAQKSHESSGAQAAIDELYEDSVQIYERARREVDIRRSDGTWQKYAAVRYKQQIDLAYRNGTLVEAINRIVHRRTLGFGHLEEARRPDLMAESLVLDVNKPYHRLFPQETIRRAEARMKEYHDRHGSSDE